MNYQNYYPVIAPLIMCYGVGDGKTTACVMAQAATIDALRKGLTLEKPTDEMECACPILRRIAIRLNDGSWWKNDLERTNTLRPLIPLLLDSKQNTEITQRRIFFMADKTVRVLTPMRLKWILSNTKSEKAKEIIRAGLQELKGVGEINSKESANAAKILCQKLKKDAYADADADAYADAYADADAYVDADAYAYAAADAYAYAQKTKYRDSLIESFHLCAAIK